MPGWEETPAHQSTSVPGNATAALPVQGGSSNHRITQTLRFSPILSP